MREFIIFLLVFILIFFGCAYLDSKKDPYEIGIHWDYSISCENGFVYKTLNRNRGTIQVLNSDGTPLKCGEKIY